MNKARTWTRQDAADYLNIHVNTFDRWRKLGRIPKPVVDTPGTKRWNPDDFLSPSATISHNLSADTPKPVASESA